MADSIYMIALDVSDARTDQNQFRSYLKNTDDFTHWWNHIPSLYLVQSHLTADQIAERLETHLNRARHLVMQVDPSASDGILPKEAWQWIRRRSDEELAV